MDYLPNGNITALGWDNPEVYYSMVDCPQGLTQNYKDCNCSLQITPYNDPETPSKASHNSNSSSICLTTIWIIIFVCNLIFAF